MFDATSLQLFQKGIMFALIIGSAYLALSIARILRPVLKREKPFTAIAMKVFVRTLVLLTMLISLIPLSSHTPKAEMKTPSVHSRAQEMQRRDPAPEIKQAAPAFERRAGNTEELGNQVRKDFEALPDAEATPAHDVEATTEPAQ